ncbi:uncharacterized protein A4U43_C02F12680 [Asparagus officinalis]|uniref:Uncharacterized protein n=1 Tax=Asparagus officinalis TaxID=4686 RepID=A0A5P1FHU1_ASPOF|nr:uncharacterized protein LOC109830680 [Asparagus officinalis]ONK77955.1 uncharacterized protein A4U43_C02F12680 [Asparagus officinalis]
MASEAKEIIVLLRQILWFSMRNIYRLGRDHPFVWGTTFFLLLLYRYLPSVFGFVLYSSPVVVCTALLLGTLLLYADPNLPETEEVRNIKGSKNSQTGFSEGKSFSVENHVAKHAAHLRKDHNSSSESESESESDHSESGSDIIPMLDELHPLLDIDAPQTARSVDNSDAASSGDSGDQESDDGSIEDETEIQEDEEEDEAQEEKDDANEVVLKWTADDQKNLMDLGTSELERNQRLENLIAKRKARKFLSFHAQRNLIDFDCDDPVPSNFQIQPISALRRNPFDIPFEEESTGLPSVPGSAPSVLQPRRNPFDIPYDEEGNSSLNRVTMRQEFVPFSLGAPSSAGIKQEELGSFLKPFFVADRINSDGPGFVTKVSSAHESDTNSSDTDHDDHMDRVEPVERYSQSSEEVDSVDAPREQIGVDEGITMGFNASNDAVEMELRQGEYSLPNLDAEKLEVIEERYDDSSSSSSEGHSEINHESTRATEMIIDSQGIDPVYDSSPSAVAKSISNTSTHDDEDALPFDGFQTAPQDRGIWVAPSSLSFVDEIESRSREINEIKEQDVLQVEVPGISEDFAHPMSPVLPKFVLPSPLFVSSSDNDNEGDEIINNTSTGKPLTPREAPIISQSDKAGDKLLNIADLPSIPEDEQETKIEQAAASSALTGIEEPSEGLSEDNHLAADGSTLDIVSSIEQSDKTSNGSVKVKVKGSSKGFGKMKNIAKFW